MIPALNATEVATNFPSNNTRSQYDILLSCWSTIFICTWVSIHPNIPPPKESPLWALWRRITLMFWALVVPELILTWAVRQWLAAKAIEKEFKERNWTIIHGYFLGMGGLSLVDPSDVELPEKPDIREACGFNLPVRPAVPEWDQDPQNFDRYYDQVNEYWLHSRKNYSEDRKMFWDNWERFQRKCTLYHNSIPKAFLDRRLLPLDEEDYARYEKYDHPLPPYIAYLRETPGTLTFYRFRDLLTTSTITFPIITAEEIADKSKGDLLSKAIAIIQTTWFIAQCVGRPCQGLAITELELVTLALASLNVLIYFLWWDKPLNVQEPVKVYYRGAIPVECVQSRNTGLRNRFLYKVLHQLSGISTTLPAFISTCIQKGYEDIKGSNPWLLPFRWFLFFPIASFVRSLYAIIYTAHISPGAKNVPTFYAMNITSSNMDLYFLFFILPVISVVFGGLHCFGWNLTFPTVVERTLWRVTSILITVIPFVSGVAWSSNKWWKWKRREIENNEVRENKTLTRLVSLAVSLFVVYVLARLSLLVQALVLLRRQPESAYVLVDWSKLFPPIS